MSVPSYRKRRALSPEKKKGRRLAEIKEKRPGGPKGWNKPVSFEETKKREKQPRFFVERKPGAAA